MFYGVAGIPAPVATSAKNWIAMETVKLIHTFGCAMSDVTATRGATRGGGYGGTGTFSKYAATVLGVYLTMALGTTVSMFLFVSFAGSMATDSLGTLGMGSARTLFGGVSVAWLLVLVLAPILAAVLGFIVGRDTNDRAAGAIVGATSNAVGFFLTMVVLLVLVLLTSPGPTALGPGLGQALVGFVGMGIGVTLTAAAAGGLGAHSQRP